MARYKVTDDMIALGGATTATSFTVPPDGGVLVHGPPGQSAAYGDLREACESEGLDYDAVRFGICSLVYHAPNGENWLATPRAHAELWRAWQQISLLAVGRGEGVRIELGEEGVTVSTIGAPQWETAAICVAPHGAATWCGEQSAPELPDSPGKFPAAWMAAALTATPYSRLAGSRRDELREVV